MKKKKKSTNKWSKYRVRNVRNAYYEAVYLHCFFFERYITLRSKAPTQVTDLGRTRGKLLIFLFYELSHTVL